MQDSSNRRWLCLCLGCEHRFRGKPVFQVPRCAVKTAKRHCRRWAQLDPAFPAGTRHLRRYVQPEMEGLTHYPQVQSSLARCFEAQAGCCMHALLHVLFQHTVHAAAACMRCRRCAHAHVIGDTLACAGSFNASKPTLCVLLQ